MRTENADAAMDALFVALGSGALNAAKGGPILFLQARDDHRLQALTSAGLVVQQNIKMFVDVLDSHGLSVSDPACTEHFARVLLLAPRQREHRRALLARAVHHAMPGGMVLASAANTEGARSMEADLSRLVGPVESICKHKCRAVWTAQLGAQVDNDLLNTWLALDVPRENRDEFVSRPGLFAWDHVDPGSALLAEHLPSTLKGRVADLGAGYGYLACCIARTCSQVEVIDLFEVDARALEPARVNLQHALVDCTRKVEVNVHWHDVSAGLPHRYDAIVSNPPFHQGRADLPALGRAFITAAADALQADGSLWMVANRHLAYEATLRTRFAELRKIADEQGFKVIEARRPRR